MAERMIRCRPLLGTYVEITSDCAPAIEAAFHAIARVQTLMSAHEPDSDLSRINRFGHERAVEVDPWTAAVLQSAMHWSRQSDGAFDVVRAGKSAIETKRLPRHPDQPAAEAAHWTELELQTPMVRLLRPGCIDLGGIAKGFAVDRAVAALKAGGASVGLVNAGGDIAGFGPQPWQVQIVEPETRRPIANVAISNGAIATSSILPDRTADHLPGKAPDLISATVCAPTAMDADALTKIVVSGWAVAVRCLKEAGAEAFVVRADGTVHAVEPQQRAA